MSAADDKGEAPQKSKGELRRERAKMQEAQRAAKAKKAAEGERAKLSGGAPSAEAPKAKPKPQNTQKPDKEKPAPSAQVKVVKKKKKDDLTYIHPAVLRLGEQYKSYAIIGGNARCIAMMQCFKELLSDFSAEKDGTRIQKDIIAKLKKPIDYLTGCRRMSVSMGNGINYLKGRIQGLPEGTTAEEAKEILLANIDDYVHEIIMADKMIAKRCVGVETKFETGRQQLKDGDVILTYARSNAIEWVFRLAHSKGVKFEVITVDSRPLHEGRKFSLTLASLGIPTTYCLLNSLSTLLPKCNKVFVGASTMLSNGSLVSRMGTAMVCMMAKHSSLPVLCFCETYKFADKVWLGSLTNNEEADSSNILDLMNGTESPLMECQDAENLKVLNYMYDLTPAETIDMVVTELGPMHPTSVPVIVRERMEKHQD